MNATYSTWDQFIDEAELNGLLDKSFGDLLDELICLVSERGDTMEQAAAAATETKKTFHVGERTIGEISADLKREIRPEHLKQKKMGGRDITYLPWYMAVKYLDHY